jgi:peroxiredoxin
MKKIFSTFCLLFVFSSTILLAQKKGFEIKFKINGLASEPLVMAYRYGDNQYIKDTIYLDSKGMGTYKGDTALQRGVYLAVVPSMKNNYFEFLINEQFFSLETDKADLNKFMKVTGSKENTVFFEDLIYMASQREIADQLTKLYKAYPENSDSANVYKNKLIALEEMVKKYRQDIMDKNPTLLYSKILGGLKEIEQPETPRKKDGSAVDTNFQYNYYHSNYWKYTDLSEEGLLRSPVYHQKLDNYFEKVIVQVPDSIIPECDKIIAATRKNTEMFKYTLVFLLNKYASSKFMGMDAVYVHLVDKYYATGQAFWMKNDTVSLYKMMDRSSKIKPTLIGAKAPNLILSDTSLKRPYSLYDLKSKYTILVFWDHDCGHCKKEIPELAKEYDKLKSLGATVYAVSTCSYEEIDKWEKFITENACNWINVGDPYFQQNPNFRTLYDISSTPVIYVLDKDKIIRAKRISVNQIEDFITKYDSFQKESK